MMNHRYLPVVLVVLLTSLAQGATITVGHTAGYDFKSITHAMAAAVAGDQIRVAMGTYSADHPEYPETFPIALKPGVTLIRATEDILPIIDANQTAQVLICEDAPASSHTRIEGFGITGGHLVSTPEVSGAGVFVINSSLVIDSCEISGNVSETAGGAIGIAPYSHLELLDCRISSNSSSSFGGAIFESTATLDIENCTFDGNHAPTSGGAIHSRYASLNVYKCQFNSNSTDGSGGAIYCGYPHADDSVAVERSTFSGNSAGEDGAAIFLSHATETTPMVVSCTFISNTAVTSGGGLYSNIANFVMAFSRFSNNNAGFGGAGVYCYSATAASICCKFTANQATTGAGCYIDTSNMQWLNCLFDLNDADEFGGGMYCLNSEASVTNATFTHNHASDDGGAIALNTTDLTMRNSILWQNEISEIHAPGLTPDIRYCDIQGGFAGTGNINTEPSFCSGVNGQHYLSQIASGEAIDSPCVNTGNLPVDQISYSHSGNTFRLIESSTRTDRADDAGIADMGFHYYYDRTECCDTGCVVFMPSDTYGPGDLCYVDVQVCSVEDDTFPDVPVFVLLDIAGYFFFAPEFDDFAFYRMSVHPGIQYIHVIPRFTWPAGVGSYSGAVWYAAMTNSDITALFGSFGQFDFGWHP